MPKQTKKEQKTKRTMAARAAEATAAENEDSTVSKGRILAQWNFPEYIKYQRGRVWYVLVFGIGGAMFLYAIFDGNFLFALILFLFAIILFPHHRSEPMNLLCTIFDAGIQIGDKFYLYREIKSFSVIYEPPLVKMLYIVPKSHIVRHEISIPLQKENPLHIRSLLLDFLEEDLDREEESDNDKWGRLLKI